MQQEMFIRTTQFPGNNVAKEHFASTFFIRYTNYRVKKCDMETYI